MKAEKNKHTLRSYKQNKTITITTAYTPSRVAFHMAALHVFYWLLVKSSGIFDHLSKTLQKKKNMLASALYVPIVPKLHPHGITYSFRSLSFQNKKAREFEV